ncbi:unnamed protein product [Prorocentrum cordatum]|uniref:Fe2OG dioxygenase domain-containing protein n=1 Tax=Prorocentrum cordatum TaxID=2364126 RepID=A0ABN9SBG3_9DINO|nr:unnamed protein product [Polarella glacialis]
MARRAGPRGHRRGAAAAVALGASALLRRAFVGAPAQAPLRAAPCAAGRCPTAAAAQATEALAAPALDFQALGLSLERDMIRPEELQAILAEARRLGSKFNRGQDSVDRQPSYELQLVDDGLWKPDAMELQQILARPIEELLARVAKLKGEQDLMVYQSWIRRYAPGERRDHPLHFDHHAKVSAVCSLTPPKVDSGLYVQPGAHVDTRQFLDMRTAGTFAVHGWDLAHGVEVRGDEERFSLILFLKPAADVASGGTSWYKPLADAGNVQASYRYGMDLEAAHDVAQAKVYYRRAADGGSWTSMHRLGSLLLREGCPDGARPLLEDAAAAGYAAAQVALGDLVSAAPCRHGAAGPRSSTRPRRGSATRAASTARRWCCCRPGTTRAARSCWRGPPSRGWADAQVALARRVAARGAEGRQGAWAWCVHRPPSHPSPRPRRPPRALPFQGGGVGEHWGNSSGARADPQPGNGDLLVRSGWSGR